LKRWLDLTFMTALALVFWTLFMPVLATASHHFYLLLSYWPLVIRFATISIVVGFFWFMLVRLGGFSFNHLSPSTFLRYPPVWLFGIVGAAGYLWFISHFQFDRIGSLTFDSETLSHLVGPVAVGLLMPGLYHLQHTRKRDYFTPEKEVPDFRSNLANQAALIKWINKESPIETPSQDYYGLATTARRIAGTLIQHKARTFGIIGP
jgi:hypothetical protein